MRFRSDSGLATLHARGRANGLAGLKVLDERAIREVEPAVRGIRAIWVPEAGIVDYSQVAAAIVDELKAARVEFQYGAEVRRVQFDAGSVRLETRAGVVTAEQVIACAGLQSDRIARMAGAAPSPKIVPFRGDYYVLRSERRPLIRGLVYPVPDPRFPFLGVHFTRRIDGEVSLGPNAVLAEIARDVWKPTFLAALRRYVPDLRGDDLLPGPSGVRAQALGPSGLLVDDFAYDFAGRLLNVRNAPSPAATSAFALASEFVDRFLERRDSGG